MNEFIKIFMKKEKKKKGFIETLPRDERHHFNEFEVDIFIVLLIQSVSFL